MISYKKAKNTDFGHRNYDGSAYSCFKKETFN